MASDMNVGMKCIKHMLFISNFLFLMIGLLLISIGSTIHAIYNDFEEFVEASYFSPANLMIAIGIIIFCIAIFGCVGAIKESVCLVNTFAFFLGLALILEIAASITAYSMRSNIQKYMIGRMSYAMNQYSNDTEMHDAVDFLQSRLGCCGVYNSNEWAASQYVDPDSNYTVPLSCCIVLTQNDCLVSDYGCLDRLSYLVSESAFMLGTGAICIAVVQLLGVIFAGMLAKAIRKAKTERERLRWERRQDLYLQLARGNDKTTPTPVMYMADTTTDNSTA